MFERLSTKFPDCDPKHLDALAAVWTREAGLVVSRMFEIYGETEVMLASWPVSHARALSPLRKRMIWRFAPNSSPCLGSGGWH